MAAQLAALLSEDDRANTRDMMIALCRITEQRFPALLPFIGELGGMGEDGVLARVDANCVLGATWCSMQVERHLEAAVSDVYARMKKGLGQEREEGEDPLLALITVFREGMISMSPEEACAFVKVVRQVLLRFLSTMREANPIWMQFL